MEFILLIHKGNCETIHWNLSSILNAKSCHRNKSSNNAQSGKVFLLPLGLSQYHRLWRWLFIGLTIGSSLGVYIVGNTENETGSYWATLIGSAVGGGIATLSIMYAPDLLLIGSFFLAQPALEQWGGVWVWAGLHAIGGVIGGAIGITIMNALSLRGLIPRIVLKREETFEWRIAKTSRTWMFHQNYHHS